MYTTLTKLKKAIGIPTIDTLNDPYLYDLIKSVSEMITKYINADITYKTFTNYKMEGTGDQRIKLPGLPVSSIASLKINDTEVKTECSIEGLNTIYREKGFEKILYTESSGTVLPNYSKKNIDVTFTSGYVLPVDYPLVSAIISNSSGDALYTSAGNTLTTDTPIKIYGTLPTNMQSMKTYYVEVITPGSTFKIKPAAGASTPILYVTVFSTTFQYQIDDTQTTLPNDIIYVTNKVCERLFISKNQPLNILSRTSDYGSVRDGTSYQLLANSIFNEQEKYILNQYKQVV